MAKKHSYEYVKECFEKGGCRLLSKEYINAHTPLDYVCSCENVSKISFNHFQEGGRCKECGMKKVADKKRHSYKCIKECFEKEWCKLLSKTYTNAHALLDYVCSCGNKSKISFAHFQQGHRCKKCGYQTIGDKKRHSFRYVKSSFKKVGCKLLSKEYMDTYTPLKYVCSCGNVSKIRFSNLLEGKRCKECGMKRTRETIRKNLPYLYKNIRFLSKEEIVCYKFLEKLNVLFVYGFTIGTNEIDFLIGGVLFWEHHPIIKYRCDESTEDYYLRRREVLDENGYGDYPLIVTTSLEDLNLIGEMI